MLSRPDVTKWKLWQSPKATITNTMKSLPIVIIRNDTEILAMSRMMKH